MKKARLFLSAAVVAVMTMTSFGQKIKEVKIGNQVWMSENLDVNKFSNGDPIPEAKTNQEWVKAGDNRQPAWCYYENNKENGRKYGKLYNWFAVTDPRGLAPKGWHVPTDAEFNQLTNFLGGADVAGTKMKSTVGWNNNGNGTNEIGFSGLPGGRRDLYGGFDNVGDYGLWWSSTEFTTYTSTDAWHRILGYNKSDLYRGYDKKRSGFSVRCLRD